MFFPFILISFLFFNGLALTESHYIYSNKVFSEYHEILKNKVRLYINKEIEEINYDKNQDFLFIGYPKKIIDDKKLNSLQDVFLEYKEVPLFISSFLSSLIDKFQNFYQMRKTLYPFISYSGSISEQSEFFDVTKLKYINDLEMNNNLWGEVFLTKLKKFVTNDDYIKYFKYLFLCNQNIDSIPFNKKLSDFILIRDQKLNKSTKNFIYRMLYEMMFAAECKNSTVQKNIIHNAKHSLMKLFYNDKKKNIKFVEYLINEFFSVAISYKNTCSFKNFVNFFTKEKEYISIGVKKFIDNPIDFEINYLHMKNIIYRRKKELNLVFEEIKNLADKEHVNTGFICLCVSSKEKNLLRSIINYFLYLKDEKNDTDENYFCLKYVDSSKKKIDLKSKDEICINYHNTIYKNLKNFQTLDFLHKKIEITSDRIFMKSYDNEINFQNKCTYKRSHNNSLIKIQTINIKINNTINNLNLEFELRFEPDYIIFSTSRFKKIIYYHYCFIHKFFNTFLYVFTIKTPLLVFNNYYISLQCYESEIRERLFFEGIRLGHYCLCHPIELRIKRYECFSNIYLLMLNLAKFFSLNSNSKLKILYKFVPLDKLKSHDIEKYKKESKTLLICDNTINFSNLNILKEFFESIRTVTDIDLFLVLEFSLKITNILGDKEKYYFNLFFNNEDSIDKNIYEISNFMKNVSLEERITTLESRTIYKILKKEFALIFSKIIRCINIEFITKYKKCFYFTSFKDDIKFCIDVLLYNFVNSIKLAFKNAKREGKIYNVTDEYANYLSLETLKIRNKELKHMIEVASRELLNYYKEKGEIQFVSTNTYKVLNPDDNKSNEYKISDLKMCCFSILSFALNYHETNESQYKIYMTKMFIEKTKIANDRNRIVVFEQHLMYYIDYIVCYFKKAFLTKIDLLIDNSEYENYKFNEEINFKIEVKMKENYFSKEMYFLCMFLSDSKKFNSTYFPKNYNEELINEITNKDSIWNIK